MLLLLSMLQWMVALNCFKINNTRITALGLPIVTNSFATSTFHRRGTAVLMSSSSSFNDCTQQPQHMIQDASVNDNNSNNNSNISNGNHLQMNQERKRILRTTIRSKLSIMTSQEISRQSRLVWDKVFQLPQYQSSKSVGLFLSMPTGEIHTYSACDRVLSDGKTLYLPRVGLDFERCDMELVRVSPSQSRVIPAGDSRSAADTSSSSSLYDHWARNKWGIPEPPVTEGGGEDDIAKPGDIDLMIVPGLGFDSNGGRLGQGKGYYDRFLWKIFSSNKDGDNTKETPFLVAVGLEPSFVPKGIPMSQHDFLMDLVILPNSVFDCRHVKEKKEEEH